MIKKPTSRFNLKDIELRIASELYCDSGPSTFCLITLEDNFTSLGEVMREGSKASDIKSKRKAAKQDAIKKLELFMSKVTQEAFV